VLPNAWKNHGSGRTSRFPDSFITDGLKFYVLVPNLPGDGSGCNSRGPANPYPLFLHREGQKARGDLFIYYIMEIEAACLASSHTEVPA